MPCIIELDEVRVVDQREETGLLNEFMDKKCGIGPSSRCEDFDRNSLLVGLPGGAKDNRHHALTHNRAKVGPRS